MTKDEAWRIIQECQKWNEGQTSISLALKGVRTGEDDLLDAKRETLKLAWEKIREDS